MPIEFRGYKELSRRWPRDYVAISNKINGMLPCFQSTYILMNRDVGGEGEGNWKGKAEIRKVSYKKEVWLQ